MYLIALCDDELTELNKTKLMLENYTKEHPEIDFTITCFQSADDLIYKIGEKMGIKAAQELRDMGSQSKIIFLTMSKEHALDAFGVDAVQYLVKPVSEKILFSVLDRFLGEVEEERKKYILLRVDGRIQRVPLNNIMYCEARGKLQCIYLVDGTQCLLRMTMAEIYEMLSLYREFIRVGIAYIVNLEYIDNLNAEDICLNTGKKIYLPRGAYKALKEQYFRYYCEEA